MLLSGAMTRATPLLKTFVLLVGTLILWTDSAFPEGVHLDAQSRTAPVAQGVKRPAISNACPGYSPYDPFSLNNRYTSGPRRGECMRLDEMRPVHILSPEEALDYAVKANLPAPAPGEIWVANIRHQNKYWVARIQPQSVEEVLYLIERFDPEGPILAALNKRRWFAAHAEVRFKFKKGMPVTLIPQFTNDSNPPIELSDLVFSSEAVRRKGEPFKPLKGDNGHYGLAKRFLSLDQVINDSIRKLGHEIAQFPIRVSGNRDQADQQRQNYLLSALRRSDRDYKQYRAGKPVMYDLRDRNCISDSLDVFDEVVDYRTFSRAMEASPEMLPKKIISGLQQRGLIHSTNRYYYPTLNKETGLPYR